MTNAQAANADMKMRLSRLRDAETYSVVLDSLQEAVFFLNAARGTIEPLNVVASRWLASVDREKSEIRGADVFPELAGAIETAVAGSLKETPIVVHTSLLANDENAQ